MKRQRHEWRDRTDDGEVRIIRANCFGANWEITWRLKRDEEWTADEPVALADLQALREKLWNKYQRKRVAYKNIEQVDTLIEDHPDMADDGDSTATTDPDPASEEE